MKMAATNFKLNDNGIPAFDDLPLRKGDPHHSAWGLYGDNDELGTLNRLTDERVLNSAKAEIQSGTRVSLNWSLSAQNPTAFFSRQVFHASLIKKDGRTVNDDIWTFNSQVSSQWDGLRHYGYQDPHNVFYNGVTMDAIHSCSSSGHPSTVNGIQAWAEQGIVGRGVLLDFDRWRVAHKPHEEFDAFKTYGITLGDMKACAEWQGTEIKFGDILLIRSGYMKQFATKSADELQAYKDISGWGKGFAGIEQSEDVLRWIWDNFSAVAGDQPSFESWPAKGDYALHEVLLAGWGCPIGELFDLEKLARVCEEKKRWSFFVSSEVCNVPGGVASPPNILAIF